jgi:hypothetical protein
VLAFLFITGTHTNFQPLTIMLLCAAVSFYYGSRS